MAEPVRVLVMDDEPAVRQLTVNVLQRFGFEPAQASEGAEAVLQYTKAMDEGRPYKVVMLDYSVPNGMGGEEALKALQAVHPEVRAVLCTGLGSGDVDWVSLGFKAQLSKPFRIQELAELVKKVAEA